MLKKKRTAQHMGEHTEKQFAYFRQKQGRNTYPERKGVGVHSNEEECSKSEARQKYTPREECGNPEQGVQ